MEYEVHPACAVIPLPPDKEIEELAESIKARGLLEPITLTPDQLLLDGRCRLRACTMVGVEWRTVVYEGDPAMYVLDKNIRRRHLSNAERELAVAKLVTLQQHGSNQFQRKSKEESSNGTLLSIEEAAQKHGVSRQGIKRARSILDKAAPHIVEMVANGVVKSYLAERAVSRAPLSEQMKWNAVDVMREGKKVIAKQPKVSGVPKTPKQPTVRRDPLTVDFSKLDIGTARRSGQPINLWPVHVQDLMDDSRKVAVAATNIVTFVDRLPISAEDFIAAVERLLAYVPVKGKTNGEEHDFAKDARKHLEFARTKFTRALDFLEKVRTIVGGNPADSSKNLNHPIA